MKFFSSHDSQLPSARVFPFLPLAISFGRKRRFITYFCSAHFSQIQYSKCFIQSEAKSSFLSQLACTLSFFRAEAVMEDEIIEEKNMPRSVAVIYNEFVFDKRTKRWKEAKNGFLRSCVTPNLISDQQYFFMTQKTFFPPFDMRNFISCLPTARQERCLFIIMCVFIIRCHIGSKCSAHFFLPSLEQIERKVRRVRRIFSASTSSESNGNRMKFLPSVSSLMLIRS